MAFSASDHQSQATTSALYSSFRWLRVPTTFSNGLPPHTARLLHPIEGEDAACGEAADGVAHENRSDRRCALPLVARSESLVAGAVTRKTIHDHHLVGRGSVVEYLRASYSQRVRRDARVGVVDDKRRVERPARAAWRSSASVVDVVVVVVGGRVTVELQKAIARPARSLQANLRISDV